MLKEIFYLLLVGMSSFTATSFESGKGLEAWDTRRAKFLSEMKPIKYCFTEKMSNDIMRVINSSQCSNVGLPLEDAIRLEYDNWLSEDWFPNDRELAAMKLDEVM